MRERMLLVAMGVMVGCGSAAPAPVAPADVATEPAPQRRIELPGWPTIEVEPLSSETERTLEIVTAGYASLPAPTERDARAWRTWIRAETDSIQVLGALARQPGPTRDRAVRVALVAAYMEAQFFAMSHGQASALLGPRGQQPRSSRDSILRSCAGLAVANEALHPWAARCEAMGRYWAAWDAWRAGPAWPDGCEDSSGPIREITDESSLGRPAVYFTWSSTSHWSPQDERTLLRAARDATREHLGDVDVLPESEVEAARDAHAAMRGADGQMCAWPPRVGTLLARRHPRLWVATITAVPPIGAGTISRLAISFSAVSGSPEGMPAGLTADVGAAASANSFATAMQSLVAEVPDERFGALVLGTTGRHFPDAIELSGFSDAMSVPRISEALIPVGPAVQACRDLDMSVPERVDAILELASNGSVRTVRLDRESMSGPARMRCVSDALRASRFDASTDRSRLVSVYGTFARNTPRTNHTRVHSEDRYASWAVGDPRVLERISACTDASPNVRVINASVHVAQNGVASHAQGDASDATTTCLENALIGSVWPCSGERDVAMRLCVDNPPAPPEPVRP